MMIIKGRRTFQYQDELGKVLFIITKENKLVILERMKE